jgi:hypothetical protein
MRRYLPVLVLLLLSPFVAEVLFGATPLSNLDALPLVTAIYGSGAILIRELARRRGTGWGRIALLGAVYALIEEGLAIQSLFNPALFNAAGYGGRALGINWVWSEWTVGYHIVWSIAVPILLAELLFPARRAEPWLGRVGVAIIGVIYVLGISAMAAIFRFIITPDYHAPMILLVGTALLAAGLVTLALSRPTRPAGSRQPETGQHGLSPWLVGLVGFLASAAWFILLDLPLGLRTGMVVLVPMLTGLALAVGVIVLLQRWSASHGWTDMHRLALASGTILTNMLVGFFGVTSDDPIDQLGQGVFSLVGLVLLAILAWRLQQRSQVTTESHQVRA